MRLQDSDKPLAACHYFKEFDKPKADKSTFYCKKALFASNRHPIAAFVPPNATIGGLFYRNRALFI
jgi:hypothetical protein